MATGDLTTVANLKSFLNITSASDDALLGRLVSTASTFIKRWLDNEVFTATYTEVRDGTGTSVLVLREAPAISITSVSIYGITVPLAATSLAYGYRISGQKLWLQGAIWPRGLGNIEIIYSAGYQLQGQTQTVSYEYRTVPAVSPYTVSALQAQYFDTNILVNLVSTGAALGQVGSNPATGQYSVSSAGVYTFNSAQAGLGVLLSYTYFFPVPQPIEQACIELASQKYKLRTRVGIKSQTIGTENMTFNVTDLPEEVKGMLMPYRRFAPV